MNDNDMANMIKKAQEMINNNQIPDELKNLVKNMQSNGTNSMNNQNNHNGTNNYSNRFNHNNSNSYSNQSNLNNSNNYNNSKGQTNFVDNMRLNSSHSKESQNYNKYSSTYSQRNSNNYDTDNSNQNNNNINSDFPNIDIETMMKLQGVMSKMKSFNNDDDMSKLLMSLKPYLRNEKKEKVDEYIKLIKMGKITQAFDLFGGDKNWICSQLMVMV